MEIRGRNVLITGGRGFLGYHLTTAVQAEKPNYLTPVGHEWNLLDWSQVYKLFDSIKPDLVFHLAAAVGGIQANIATPASFFAENVRMGLNVLDACVQHKVTKLVIAGTSCSYPELAISPLLEKDLFDGYPVHETAAYGMAKRAILVAAMAYREQFGLSSTMAVLANLYGPGDHYETSRSHVIPSLIRKAHEAKDVLKVWGNPDTVREFLYVVDAAQALVAVAKGFDAFHSINVGTGQPTTIGRLAELIATLTNPVLKIEYDRSKPVGSLARWLDTQICRQWFGWQARTDLSYGLNETIKAYRSSPVEQPATVPLHP